MTKSTPRSAVGRLAPAGDRILSSARHLFYDRGIRAVGVDAIVADAGVTKPSLYRSFPSKDELAACYLRNYEADFWASLSAAANTAPNDPVAQILTYFDRLVDQTESPELYRGCGLSNATVEYPEQDHPARLVAVAHKRELRLRLAEMARKMKVRSPEALGDGLMLLLEGAFISGQIFGAGGPARRVREMAELLIKASR